MSEKGSKKRTHWYCLSTYCCFNRINCLSMYCCYNRMRNSVAYCCRDFIVHRRKALLSNHLALLCYDSWASRKTGDVLLWQSAYKKWDMMGCIGQDGPDHGVGDFARFSHSKITFWVNHKCEKFDGRCKQFLEVMINYYVSDIITHCLAMCWVCFRSRQQHEG